MKRFYKAVAVEPENSGWRVLLDGRGIKTASGKPQVVPTRALADATHPGGTGHAHIEHRVADHHRVAWVSASLEQRGFQHGGMRL